MGCCGSSPAPLAGPPAGCGPMCPTKELVQYTPDQLIGHGKWWTTDRFTTLPPRRAPDPSCVAGQEPATLTEVFAMCVKKHGDKPALMVERKADGSSPDGQDQSHKGWQTWTWKQYYDESVNAARGFLALGLQEKGSVCVYGFNSPEWFMAEQGAMFANGAVCGIYPTDKVDNVQYKARHTACNVAVVENEKQLKIFKEAVEDKANGGVPTLRAVVLWAPGQTPMQDFTSSSGQPVRVLSWQQLVKDWAVNTTPGELEEVQKKIVPGALCGYIYTSGTTGRPKAVMISHDNVAYMARSVEAIAPELATKTQERVISYLPLSHVAGLLMDIAVPMFMTCFNPAGGWFTVYFARPTDLSQMTLAARIQDVRPTIFLGVPRVWEKIRDTMIAKAKANKLSPTDQKRVDGAKARGREWALNNQMGGSGKRPGGCIDHFIDGKVYAKVKGALGLTDCKFALTGAAPIDDACLGFFGQLGININELYGMSECCGATTASSNRAHVWGSCGFALPGAEVKVFAAGEHGDCSAERPKRDTPQYPKSFAELLRTPAAIDERYQGEVCYRGRHIMMGYLANPDLGDEHVAEIAKKTAEAIDSDGWLHSGDKGAMDCTGMVKITGRFKEIIIPAGGENVSPVPIEEAVKKDPAVSDLISNVMMVGDKRKYCVALVSLKVVGATGQEPGGQELTAPAREVVKKVGGTATTVPEAMSDPKVIEAIAKAIAGVNKNSAVCPIGAATIKSFTIIPVDFSENGGQLTATLKLKRSVVEAEHPSMVGVKDSVDGVDPGQTGLLYKGPLEDVPGVGKCYAKYEGPALT
eukprot:TRINITY_DN8171_c0_g3_i2.p1 TRINITY_DN8171_c0_g3~~TRINITY_DN8171_c0_g3_i2.p1  ORF type:complete len:838 (+),score=242.06 TRINITY_DN8171_c0_g3_i2:85-2514(+)